MKTSKINQFISDNKETLTVKQLAEKCNISENAVRLRSRRLVSKIKATISPFEKAYKAKATKVLTKVEIQAYILANHSKMSNKEIAKKLNLTTIKIGANKATLKKYGKLGTKKSTNSYNNHNGENKAKARIKMVNHIVESNVDGIIPTLPNTGWAIEQMVNKCRPNNTYLGVERDPKTFKVMKSTLKTLKTKGLNASTHLGSISEVIFGKRENSYAHMILDYCGNLATVTKELEYSIQNDIIAVDGTIALTFSKPIRGIDSESLKLLSLSAENNSDDRCKSDKAIEAYFHKITGFNYTVVEFFYYQDTYPMTLVIIKRLK